MSKIDRVEVERIAALAHIGLSSTELDNISDDLVRFVGFVEQLQSVDVADTLPTDQVTGLEDVWREDVVVPSMPRDILLANAPEQADGYIVARRVL